MIRPQEYAASISKISLACRPDATGTRQITDVCVKIKIETDSDVEIAFPIADCPSAEVPTFFENALVAPPLFEKPFVWVKLPKGPCRITSAWSHSIKKVHDIECVFVPTLNDCLSKWIVKVHIKGCDPSIYATPVAESDWHTIKQKSKSLPFHNLYFPIVARSHFSRKRIGISGAVVVDETALQLVRCYDAGFQLLLSVNGCFVRDSLSYATAHIPLVISERVTSTYGPLIVRDAPDGVTCHVGDGNVYRINLMNRSRFKYLDWVEIEKVH